jgi:hypothetical protein
MPVKVKQKQTKKIEWVDYEFYEYNIMNNDLYRTLVVKDIYELYNRKTGIEVWQTTIEKNKALEAINKHPNIFRIEYSKKNTQKTFFFFLFEYIPVKIAEAILVTITSHPGTKVVKIVSNIIKYFLMPIIVGLIILLIWFFLHPYLSQRFKHD